MNNEFKILLLKIASLPKTDQKWMLTKLSANQQKQFEHLEGIKLLSKSQRFRKLACPKAATTKPAFDLPRFCQDLINLEPLYIAIILEQGQFHWEEGFLQSLDNRNEVHQLINNQVTTLKPDTKSRVFKLWQEQQSFDDQLVMLNG